MVRGRDWGIGCTFDSSRPDISCVDGVTVDTVEQGLHGLQGGEEAPVGLCRSIKRVVVLSHGTSASRSRCHKTFDRCPVRDG